MVPMVPANMPLYDILHQFQTGRSHMAVVLDHRDHISVLGIITLEDVLEELLQEEILDEDDFRRSKISNPNNNISISISPNKIIGTSPLKQGLLADVTSSDVKLTRAFSKQYSTTNLIIPNITATTYNNNGTNEKTPLLGKNDSAIN